MTDDEITAYEKAEQRVSIELIRGDEVPRPSKDDIALSESSYRRGFQQGIQACIEAMRGGADVDDLTNYRNLVGSWRFRLGKWRGTTYDRAPPPDWTGRGIF